MRYFKIFKPELREVVDVQNRGQWLRLPLNELRPNPYQPRKTFDEVSLQELANSIEQSGVFQPIIVRKSAVKGYEIIAGERRFRASKLAKKKQFLLSFVILMKKQ
jgi:ParB family chromosome partitioning protein